MATIFNYYAGPPFKWNVLDAARVQGWREGDEAAGRVGEEFARFPSFK